MHCSCGATWLLGSQGAGLSYNFFVPVLPVARVGEGGPAFQKGRKTSFYASPYSVLPETDAPTRFEPLVEHDVAKIPEPLAS